MEYFFILNGVKQGPYNKEAIKKFVAEGVITRETVIAFPDGREIPAGKLNLPFDKPLISEIGTDNLPNRESVKTDKELVKNDEEEPSVIDEIPSLVRSIFIVFAPPVAVFVLIMMKLDRHASLEDFVTYLVACTAVTSVIYLVFHYLSKIAIGLEKQNTLIEQLLKTDAGDSSGTKK